MAGFSPPNFASVRLVLGLGSVALAASLSTACGDPAVEEAAPEASPSQVRAHRAEKGTARSWIYGQGTAQAVRRELLTFEADGRVAYIAESAEGRPLQVGDRVRGPDAVSGERHGQLLMSLDSRDEAAAVAAREAELARTEGDQAAGKSDVDSARTEYETAKSEYERVEALFDAKVSSQSELDDARSRRDRAKASLDSARARAKSSRSGTEAQQVELERARLGLEKTSIFAPFDGVVAYLNVREGDYYFAGSLSGRSESERLGVAPVVIIDPSAFEVTVHIPAYEADAIERGQTALLLGGAEIAEVSAGERSIFDSGLEPVFAEVYAVSPSVDPSSRTVEVKLRTTAGAEGMRDGEFVTCWIITEIVEDTVIVPFDAIVRGESGPRAFVVDEATSTVQARSLRLGVRDMIGIEVREGVAPGERLVTAGRHAIADGTRVEVVGEDRLPNPEDEDVPEPEGDAVAAEAAGEVGEVGETGEGTDGQ